MGSGCNPSVTRVPATSVSRGRRDAAALRSENASPNTDTNPPLASGR